MQMGRTKEQQQSQQQNHAKIYSKPINILEI